MLCPAYATGQPDVPTGEWLKLIDVDPLLIEFGPTLADPRQKWAEIDLCLSNIGGEQKSAPKLREHLARV